MTNSSKDCLSCRLISCLTLTGIGLHAIRQTRPQFPGSPASKAVLLVVGTGKLSRSYYALTYIQPEMLLIGLTIMGLVQGIDIIKDPNWERGSKIAVPERPTNYKSAE